MRSPSVKTLTSTFRDLTPAKARLIKRIASAASYDGSNLASVIEKCCPTTQSYVMSLHSSPYRSHMWRVTVALHAISDLVDGHGVEGLGPAGSGSEGYAPPYEYVNMGDTYSTTLIYKRATDTLSIGSWGDVAEAHPSWE